MHIKYIPLPIGIPISYLFTYRLSLLCTCAIIDLIGRRSQSLVCFAPYMILIVVELCFEEDHMGIRLSPWSRHTAKTGLSSMIDPHYLCLGPDMVCMMLQFRN